MQEAQLKIIYNTQLLLTQFEIKITLFEHALHIKRGSRNTKVIYYEFPHFNLNYIQIVCVLMCAYACACACAPYRAIHLNV